MLLSIALILIVGMFTGWLCKKIHLPALIGMLATGIILGPQVFNLLDDNILTISADIRRIALIIILTRAGLGLDLAGLKKNGRPALLMCFLPATFELIGILILGPMFLGLSRLESAILGAVLAAVSPAVVVPRMVKLTEEKYGTKEGIPQLILAGASVDDVYVIVLFTTFLGMIQGEGISVMSFINIPVSIILGILIGYVIGVVLAKFWSKFNMRDTAKVIVVLCISLLLVVAEDNIPWSITFAALISVMIIGVGIQRTNPEIAKNLSAKFGKLWVGAEVFLFVLVGATVQISSLKDVGLAAVVVIILGLAFRMVGAFACTLGTKLTSKERLFTMISYTPKATVQAAIGGIPLAAGLACGNTILTVAVLAIVITAPVGATAIDLSYKKLLKKSED